MWQCCKLQRIEKFDCVHLCWLCVQCTFRHMSWYNVILIGKSYTKRYANYAICTTLSALHTHTPMHELNQFWMNWKNRKHNDTTGKNTKKRNNREWQQNVVHNLEWRTQILIKRHIHMRALTVYKHAKALTHTHANTFHFINELNIFEQKFHRTWWMLGEQVANTYSGVRCKKHYYWLLRYGKCRSHVSLMMYRQKFWLKTCARKKNHSHA